MGSPAFRLYVVGQLVSTIGTWLQNLALGLLVLELTGSAGALGGITAVQFLPAMLLGAGAGVVLDRVDLRRFMIGSALVAGALAAGLGLVITADRATPVIIIGVTLGLGIFQAFERPAALAFLPMLVDQRQLPSAFGLNATIAAVGRLAGPAIGGFTYAVWGPEVCFLANGASYLVVLFTLARIRPDALRRPPTARRITTFRAGLRHARATPPLREILSLNGIIGLLAMNFAVVIPAMIYLVYDGDATAVGAAHSLNAVGAVVGGVLSAVVLRESRRSTAVVCALLGVAILALALAPSLLVFLALSPLFGLVLALYQAGVQRIVQAAAHPDAMGQMMSLLVLGSIGTTPVGSLLVGWLTDAVSARASMGLGAVGCIGAAGFLLVAARSAAHRRPALLGEPSDDASA